MTDSRATDAAELLEALAVATGADDPFFSTADQLAAVGVNADGTARGRHRSMVRLNGKELPERVCVYDAKGGEHHVPTAQIAYYLNKKRADNPSQRAFFAKKPDVPDPTYIDRTCEICIEWNVRKKFPSERQYRAHMSGFHPDEWEEEREAVRDGKTSILGLLGNMSADEKKALRAVLSGDTKGAA